MSSEKYCADKKISVPRPTNCSSQPVLMGQMGDQTVRQMRMRQNIRGGRLDFCNLVLLSVDLLVVL